jgi:subtilisin family serine protease
MKPTLIALGTLASIAVLSDSAWAACPNCGVYDTPYQSSGGRVPRERRGGDDIYPPNQPASPYGGRIYRRGGGGGSFGSAALGGLVGGIIGGVIATPRAPVYVAPVPVPPQPPLIVQEQPRRDPYSIRTRATKKSEPEKQKPVRPAAVPQPPKTKVGRAAPPATPPKPPSALPQRPPSLPPPSLPVAAPGDENRFVPDEIMFEVRNSAPAGAVDDIARQQRLTRISSQRLELAGSTVYRYRINDGRPVAAVAQALEQDVRIAATQPNFVYRLAEDPARNSLSGTQYAVSRMRLPEAHRVSTGLGISVAVIDSAIDSTHPELAGSIADAFDAIDGAAKPHKHGTAVAGIIGSHANLMGVAPRAKLLAIRAFASEGGKIGAEGTTDHVVRSIEWAHQRGARIVNMSFTGPRDPLLSRELRAGKDKGIVFVVAAGNDGPNAAAADDSVIAVTASDTTDKLYPAANRGPHVCLAAPGVDVLVASPSGSYEFKSGTSLAAAHVSGAIALLLQSRPDLNPTAVRTILLNRARRLSTEAGSDGNCGIGVADALALVTEPSEKQGPEEPGSTALAGGGELSPGAISRTASPLTSRLDQKKD